MSPTEISLLGLTVSFLSLIAWVYWPSRRHDIEAHALIPLTEMRPSRPPHAQGEPRE